MKGFVATALTVVIFMLMGFALRAEEGEPGRAETLPGEEIQVQKPVKPKPAGRHFIGIVVAVDIGAKTLIARNWRGQVVFDTARARFARPQGLEEIEPGERVVVRYVDEAGRKVARTVATAASKAGQDHRSGQGDMR